MVRKFLFKNFMFQMEKENNQSISCINGYIDKITNKCICYPGWKTLKTNYTNIIKECNFDTGLNKTNNLRNPLKNNNFPFFEKAHSSDYFLILFCIIIQISLIFILRYFYNKYKKKLDIELEKTKELDSYMTENEQILYELNYINSFPIYFPYNTRNTNNPKINEDEKQNKLKNIDKINIKKYYLEDDDDDNGDFI